MLRDKIDTLKNKKEFDFVYKNSNKFRSDIFDICILEKKAQNGFYTRFKKSKNMNLIGLSVSKKIGKAVERNLIKRRLRAICRDLFGDYKQLVCIIIAKNLIKQTPFVELKKHINAKIGCEK